MSPRARLLLGVVLLAVMLALPQAVPVYFTHLIILAMIYGIVAMSLDLLLGFTGLTSFGHAAYFGVAAYAVGVLSTRLHAHSLVAMAGGVAAAVVVAMIYGLLAIRATGVYFLIITLALGMGTWGLAYRWVSITGGDNGLPGIPALNVGLPWSMRDPVNLYYFIALVFLLAVFAAYRFVVSPFGLTLRGIRESESRMRLLGYNVWLHKYIAFVVAAAFAGLAGTLYAFYNGFVAPTDLQLSASAEAVLMVILGGAGTLFGPVIGAALVVFLRNLVSAYTQRWLLILGTVFILTVIYAPRGVLGGARALWDRVRPRVRPEAPPLPAGGVAVPGGQRSDPSKG
jgi:branched-chain amino acid transport system permease protein